MANLVAQLWEIFTSERFNVYRNVAAGVVSLYLLRKIFSISTSLWSFSRAYLLAPYGIFRTNLKNYGSWAVVTGASEGIGKGYATELARRGLNVVIMSRSEKKLQKVADEIKAQYDVEVMVIAVDFSSGQEIYPQLAQQLKNLNIGVLVNNVGLTSEYPDDFLNISEQRLRNIIEINCQAMIQLTHMLLPKMVEKKRGVVINISSAAALFPMPLYTVYSASKVFVNYFSEALGREYAAKGIVVQTIMPLGVATNSSDLPTSFFIPTPAIFARSVLNTVGIISVTPGYYPHVLQDTVFQLLPRGLADYYFQNFLKTMRQKALLKKAALKRED